MFLNFRLCASNPQEDYRSGDHPDLGAAGPCSGSMQMEQVTIDEVAS